MPPRGSLHHAGKEEPSRERRGEADRGNRAVLCWSSHGWQGKVGEGLVAAVRQVSNGRASLFVPELGHKTGKTEETQEELGVRSAYISRRKEGRQSGGDM